MMLKNLLKFENSLKHIFLESLELRDKILKQNCQKWLPRLKLVMKIYRVKISGYGFCFGRFEKNCQKCVKAFKMTD